LKIVSDHQSEESSRIDKLEQVIKNEIDLRVEVLKEQLDEARKGLITNVEKEFDSYRR